MSRNVVIVGGGTAGWMTASYVKAAFADRVDVTVVESARVDTIGVGEATFSTIRHFFEYLGLEEDDWMPACHATYKLGIRFRNWRHEGHTFYHSFERTRFVDGFPLTDWWMHNGPSPSFDKDCYVIPWLCQTKRSPKYFDGRLFEQDFTETATKPVYRSTMTEQGTQFPYAYHFDATLLAKFLQRYAVDRGVRHVLDDVVDVSLDQRGWIDRIVTREHGEMTGDLFVDCTGFRSLLLGKALGEPFESFQASLPNDRAVALRVPSDMAVDGIRPCTSATAQDAGWIWTIPLFGRIGTGYVYASDYCSAEDAERTLREFVGPAADGLEANHIRMRIGRMRNSWVNNCVAIGLSSGFVEPLESTGIFFIQYAIEQLVKHYPNDGWDERLRDSYNRLVNNSMDGVRQFLVLHYRCAARVDNDYWRDAKHRPMPDGLAERLALWQDRAPDPETVFPHYHGFETYSYVVMLMGLGGLPMKPPPALGLLPEKPAQREFQLIQEQAQDLLRSLPSQAEYFSRLQAAAG